MTAANSSKDAKQKEAGIFRIPELFNPKTGRSVVFESSAYANNTKAGNKTTPATPAAATGAQNLKQTADNSSSNATNSTA